MTLCYLLCSYPTRPRLATAPPLSPFNPPVSAAARFPSPSCYRRAMAVHKPSLATIGPRFLDLLKEPVVVVPLEQHQSHHRQLPLAIAAWDPGPLHVPHIHAVALDNQSARTRAPLNLEPKVKPWPELHFASSGHHLTELRLTSTSVVETSPVLCCGPGTPDRCERISTSQT
jgi:hypothetical protein